MDIDDRIYRAARAQEVIDNEAFTSAVKSLNDEVLKQWQATPARDTQGREHLWIYQKLLGKLVENLKATMLDGQQAKLDLSYKQTLAEKARRLLRVS